MRRDTKIAIVVACVFIGLGGWYVFKDRLSFGAPGPKNDSTATAAKEKDTAKPSPMTTARNPNTNKPPEGLRLNRPTSLGRNTTGTPTPQGRTSPVASGSPTASPPPSGMAMATTPRPSPFSPTPSGLGTTTQPSGTSARPTLQPPINVEAQGAARPTPGSGAISLAGNDNKLTSPARPTGSLTDKKSTEAEKTHVVAAGETFTSLAVKYYGHAKHTGLIAKANPSVDPRKLRVGTKLIIPPAPEGQAAMAGPSPTPGPTTPTATPIARTAKAEPVPTDRAYTIKAGEGYYNLAQRFLGSGERWTELYELNKERVPHNPHHIPPGTVIELPKDANMSAPATPTTKPAGTTKTTKAEKTEKTEKPKKATE